MNRSCRHVNMHGSAGDVVMHVHHVHVCADACRSWIWLIEKVRKLLTTSSQKAYLGSAMEYRSTSTRVQTSLHMRQEAQCSRKSHMSLQQAQCSCITCITREKAGKKLNEIPVPFPLVNRPCQCARRAANCSRLIELPENEEGL